MKYFIDIFMNIKWKYLLLLKMKKQNLVRPTSSDQFLKKGGFKVFHFDKSNISSIGKLISAPKKIIKKYPPLPEFN